MDIYSPECRDVPLSNQYCVSGRTTFKEFTCVSQSVDMYFMESSVQIVLLEWRSGNILTRVVGEVQGCPEMISRPIHTLYAPICLGPPADVGWPMKYGRFSDVG